MIIDFAVRPPYKGFLSLVPSFQPGPPPKDWRHVSPWSYDCDPAPSKLQESMALFMAEMDEAGISRAVVNHEGGRSNPELAPAFAVSNDEIAELGELYPDRFFLFGGINLDDVPAGVAEIERVVEMGFKGVTVNTGWHDPPQYMDDERFYPIYEKCQELDIILSITLSIYMGPDISYIKPVRLQHIAADFPDLLIVVNHGGWPFVMEILGITFRYPNVWLAPDFYMFREGIPGAGHYVEAANFYLADRILFSSVYPSRPMKQSVEEFKKLPLRPEVLEKALFRNAQWILGDRQPWPDAEITK
jgi:predicted TIM-barrel fold metal-dependent hydrolase